MRPLPAWGADLFSIDFEDIHYYMKPIEGQGKTWEDVPADIKNTFDKLGIPEAERKFLAGVSAQYESEVVYHSIKEDLEKQGVIFTDMDSGLREHPEMVKKYFGTVIPYKDNKFAALNTAVWSGGSFVYIPKGVHVDIPLQAYFRINAKNAGQFERTLIIAERGQLRPLHRGLHRPDLVRGQPALGRGRADRPGRGDHPLHHRPELVEQRLQHRHQARRRLRGRHRGLDRRQPGQQGDHEVPLGLPDGRGPRRRSSPAAFANNGQVQDAGGQIYHCAPNTTSTITSKSVTKGTGGPSSGAG